MNCEKEKKVLSAKIICFRTNFKLMIETKIAENIRSLGETVQPFHLQEAENHPWLKAYDEWFNLNYENKSNKHAKP